MLGMCGAGDKVRLNTQGPLSLPLAEGKNPARFDQRANDSVFWFSAPVSHGRARLCDRGLVALVLASRMGQAGRQDFPSGIRAFTGLGVS